MLSHLLAITTRMLQQHSMCAGRCTDLNTDIYIDIGLHVGK